MADVILTAKTCRKCFGEIPGAKCRHCANIAAAKYRSANYDKTLAATAKWRAENVGEIKAARAKHYAENAEAFRAKSAAFRMANPEKVKASTSAWAALNVEKMRKLKALNHVINRDKNTARSAAYQIENKEMLRLKRVQNVDSIAKSGVAYRVANHENIRARILRWNALNAPKLRVYTENRRSRRVGNGGTLSHGLAEKLMILQKGMCACCGQKLVRYHLDHVIPLALGGRNSDENMQLLTPRCNRQKGAKSPEEFMRRRGFLI